MIRPARLVRFVPILLQKFFWGGEPKFLEPLMRFTRGNVRDHIVSHRNDHRPPYRSFRALQWRRLLKIHIHEIFGVARFSTFATLSAKSRHILCLDTNRQTCLSIAAGELSRQVGAL